MSERTGNDDGGRRGTDRPVRAGASRRAFLRATAGVGALAAAGGATLVGTAGAAGIPTPWLDRDGNLVRDQNGNRVVLRGVNVIDPARAVETDWRRPITESIEHAIDEGRGWHSRVIRVPIQPGDVAQDGQGYGSEPDPVAFDRSTLETYLETYLDPAIEKCAEVGVYCIVDYHRHRTHELEYTDPALHDEVTMFWETVAPRYAEDSHVLYEVYNEPISPFVGFRERDVNVDITDPEAEDTWLTWREAGQPWVDTIREHAPRNLVLIGSPSWSQWTYWADEREFAGDNLAYTGHVYAHPNLRPLGEYFGKPAENVPVFLTEFGWEPEGNEYFQGTVSEEGEDFVSFFEEHDSVHWTVWCFDHIWEPVMFEQDDETKEWHLLSGEAYHGEFFRAYLAEKRADDLPEGEAPGTIEPTAEVTPTPADTPTPTAGQCPEGTDAPESVGGAYPQDLDGDGLHRDVNANCRLDSDDVVTYFEHMEDPAVTENVGAYDYNANSRIDFDDLVTLFESL